MTDHPTPPSSVNLVKSALVENAFPTPPREESSDSSFLRYSRFSPAPRKLFHLQQRARSTPPGLTNDSGFRSINRGTVGDLPDAQGLEQSWDQQLLSKKKSQYYSEAFAYREPSNTAKDRVARDSVILAEVKLNCCVSKHQKRMN
jgi:hypothetical protein